MKLLIQWSFCLTILSLPFIGYSQTLVKVGNKEISVEEFNQRYQNALRAGENYPSKKAYLDAVISYELKLASANQQKLEETFSVVNELNYYKEHLLQLNKYDLDTYDQLVLQAKERSKVNLSVSYIVIPINLDQPAIAQKSIEDAYKTLIAGKSFEEVALAFSKDISVQENKGHIGYISSFTLPYKIENILYSLVDGNYSKPFQFANKWYIFKRNHSQPSKGKIQIQQLVFYYPGEVNNHLRDSLKQLATVVKKQIDQGLNFDDAIEKYSVINQNNRGIQNPIGVGEYDPSFENEIFKLKNMGEISDPIETSFGFHLVKLLKIIAEDSLSADAWKSKIESNDRIAVAYDSLHQKIESRLQLKRMDSAKLVQTLDVFQHEFKQNQFTTDSTLVLAQYANQKIELQDWKRYFAIISRNKTQFDHPDLYFYFNQFLQQRLLSYYRSNIEQYDPVFSKNMQTFKESILIFELMKTNIWNKMDSTGLHQYYAENVAQFKWEPYAKAYQLTSLTQEDISPIIRNIQSIDQLKRLTSNEVYYIQEAKIPLTELENNIQPGTILKKQDDGIQTVIGIESIHAGGEIKTFDEALMEVSTAYQSTLESSWMEDLKKQFPVIIQKKAYKKL